MLVIIELGSAHPRYPIMGFAEDNRGLVYLQAQKQSGFVQFRDQRSAKCVLKVNEDALFFLYNIPPVPKYTYIFIFFIAAVTCLRLYFFTDVIFFILI